MVDSKTWRIQDIHECLWRLKSGTPSHKKEVLENSEIDLIRRPLDQVILPNFLTFASLNGQSSVELWKLNYDRAGLPQRHLKNLEREEVAYAQRPAILKRLDGLFGMPREHYRRKRLIDPYELYEPERDQLVEAAKDKSPVTICTSFLAEDERNVVSELETQEVTQHLSDELPLVLRRSYYTKRIVFKPLFYMFASQIATREGMSIRAREDEYDIVLLSLYANRHVPVDLQFEMPVTREDVGNQHRSLNREWLENQIDMTAVHFLEGELSVN